MIYDLQQLILKKVDQTLERRSNLKVLIAQILNDPRLFK
jgi:hypothetical protein